MLDRKRAEEFRRSASARRTRPGADPRAKSAVPKRPTGESAAGRLKSAQTLAERYGAPPFSVLDARQGYWRDRRRAWLALGIDSGAGRPDVLTWAPSSQSTQVYDHKNAYEAEIGRKVSYDEFIAACPDVKRLPQVSIFDPVLAELMIAWFSPPGGSVLDPFAGGSVRGLVAAKLGRLYTGIELRPEQIRANERQCFDVLGYPSGLAGSPVWIEADSAELEHLVPGPYDFIFSCPPYFDLERYSDDPRDLSAMSWPDFRAAYGAIIAQAAALLRPDRFACYVVGDVRDRRGNYRNLIGHTVMAFQAAGLELYNEGIYVPPVGSLPVRAGGSFKTGRKLGKAHQNALVFVKGSWREAARAAGAVELAALEAVE